MDVVPPGNLSYWQDNLVRVNAFAFGCVLGSQPDGSALGDGDRRYRHQTRGVVFRCPMPPYSAFLVVVPRSMLEGWGMVSHVIPSSEGGLRSKCHVFCHVMRNPP